MKKKRLKGVVTFWGEVVLINESLAAQEKHERFDTKDEGRRMKERRAKGGRMIRRRREDERAIGRKNGGREDEGQKMKDEKRRK